MKTQFTALKSVSRVARRREYRLFSRVLLRSPVHALVPGSIFEPLLTNTRATVASITTLRTLANAPSFQEAVLLASSSLHDRWMQACNETIDEGDAAAILEKLLLYALRMRGRATPFGVFATLSTLPVRDTKHSVYGRCVKLERRTRFSLQTLADLYGDGPSVQRSGAYDVNTAGVHCFLETAWANGETPHRIAHSPLETVSAEAACFGWPFGSYVKSYRAVANRLRVTNSRAMSKLKRRISKLDKTIRNDPCEYRAIQDLLANSFHIRRSKNCLNVELYETRVDGALGLEEVNLINNAARALKACRIRRRGLRLNSFKQRFALHYGTEVDIPLHIALDSVLGLGYPAGEDSQLHLDAPAASFLRRRFLKASCSGAEISVEDHELAALERGAAEPDLCRSAVASILLCGERKVVQYIGGANAIFAFSRHDHWPHIRALAREIATTEAGLYHEALVAELLHVPNLRLGDIVLHERVRRAEISLSVAPVYGCQLRIQDLYLRLVRNRLLLRSRSRNCEVRVMVSNAHSFWKSGHLDIYRFFGDLQFQDSHSFDRFEWPISSDEASFFPRVRYGSAVLNLATWIVRGKASAGLRSQSDLSRHMDQLDLPKNVFLCGKDGDIPIDRTDKRCLWLCHRELERAGRLILKECGESKRPCIRELLMPIWTKTPATKPSRRSRPFNIGGEHSQLSHHWLSYSLTAPHTFTNWFFSKHGLALLEPLVRSGSVLNWHFVRNDLPMQEFKLRLQLRRQQEWPGVHDQIGTWLKSYITAAIIPRLSVDVYSREVGIYGPAWMPTVEKIFHCQCLLGLDMQTLSADGLFLTTLFLGYLNIRTLFPRSTRRLQFLMSSKRAAQREYEQFATARSNKRVRTLSGADFVKQAAPQYEIWLGEHDRHRRRHVSKLLACGSNLAKIRTAPHERIVRARNLMHRLINACCSHDRREFEYLFYASCLRFEFTGGVTGL